MNFLPKDYDLEAEWKKVEQPFEHPDFVTHANYLHFMSEISKDLVLSCNLKINNKITLDKRVSQKLKLIELILENLKEEQRNIEKYPEYSIVCVSWIPVKSYYLIFNLLVLLEYLITCSNTYLTVTHHTLLNDLRRMLNDNILSFNKDIFNHIYTVGDIESWKIPKWENVKKKDSNPELRLKQIIRKLSLYSKEEFKRTNKLNRLVGKKKSEFGKSKINLCEFVYWYRIKANYRDMEFIDKGVPVQEFVDFYNDYYDLSINFYLAINKCINNLAMLRTGNILIN